jgi:tetratricopeptide (TPR) repeat protein
LKASAGNPLFVEELVAMLVEEGVLRPENGSWALERELDSVALPASLNGLLGARLDRLDDGVRGVLERGAIEGELFHRGAIAELSAPEERLSVPAQLETLAGKDYVLPAEASFGGEAAFRFRHILIREAAYGATAKKLRAELHERFAGWLERIAGDRIGEYEEIVGYHLEQSFRYRSELGPVDDEARALGGRAARRLGAGGRRASARGDLEAAISFLTRAAALLPAESRERIELLPDLIEALYEAGRLEDAETHSAEGIEAVEALRDEHLIALARVQRAWFKAHADPGWSEWALAEAERAIPVFERAGDDGALARAWETVFAVHWLRGKLTAARAAAERGFAHAERSGDERQQGRLRIAMTAAGGFGFLPQDEVAEEMERDLAWARRTGSLWLEALLIQAMGTVQARRGDPRGGEKLIALGMSTIADLGMRLFAAGLVPNWIWHVTDDPVVAEARLRESYNALLEAGDKAMAGSVAASLGEALYQQGRYEEAEEMVRVGEGTAAADDIYLQVLWRAVRAKVLARRELLGEAEALAREALALAYESEYVDARSDAQLALAEVLRLAGRAAEAAEAVEAARALHEAKGNVLQVERARIFLAELHSGAGSRSS